MSNFGKQVSVIVEIDVEYCGLEYGVGACPAVLGTDSATKCYNFYNGCPVKASFSKTTKTLRYSMGQLHGIRDVVIYPFLKSVSTNATTITLGNVDERLGSLGKRARITVALDDQRESDIDLDKYVSERSYNAEEQGTHFGRLHARWPFYYGRALRVLTGYVGDPMSSYHVRSYIITKWAGPTGSSVTITAQDPLKLADEELAKAPAASGGVLGSSIGSGLEGFRLNPDGIGSDYPSEGYANIGGEIVSYTRSFRNITLTGRGLFGTEASGHDEGDTFQECLYYEDQKFYDVGYDLLTRTNIDPSTIPLADHEAEIQSSAPTLRLTRLISEPTGIAKLLGQMSQMGFTYWWGEVDQELKLRANRPPNYDEAATVVTDAANIAENTVSVRDLPDLLVTRIYFYHGVIDYTADMESADNYKKLTVIAPLTIEGELQNNQEQILTIYGSWLGQDGDENITSIIGQRLQTRFNQVPKEVSFTADVKDRASLDVGQLVYVQTYGIQNEDGSRATEQAQVVSVQPDPVGDLVTITTQTYLHDAKWGYFLYDGNDYDNSTAEQQLKGAWFHDDTDPDEFEPTVWY